MAKNSFTDYSTTADSNADIGGVNIAENCPAANINNAIRLLMAHTAEQFDADGTGKVDRVKADKILLDDNKPIEVGAGADLTIKHDGSASSIINAGNMDLGTSTGDLRIRAGDALIATASSSGLAMASGKGLSGKGDEITITASASVTATTNDQVSDYSNLKALLEDLLARVIALETLTPYTAASDGGLSVSSSAFKLDASNIPDA